MTNDSPTPELRHCIKCGREVGADESICEICNRAGMATPSATQYHGTIAVAIVVAVAALAWAASASLEGVGPYTAEVNEVTAAELGYEISYTVRNEGSRAGRAKCQVVALDDGGRRLRALNTVTPQIVGGDASLETVSIPGLDNAPASVSVTCS